MTRTSAKALTFAHVRSTVRGMGKTRFGVWDALRVTRERTGFSAAELAKRAGMSPGYLSDLENGNRWPNAKTIKKLAVALNCPTVVLERHDHPDRPCRCAEIAS